MPACLPACQTSRRSRLHTTLRDAHLCHAPHPPAQPALQAGISDTLRNLLATSSLLSTTAGSPGNVLRSTDQLGDLISLAAALLPAMPDPATAMRQGLQPVQGGCAWVCLGARTSGVDGRHMDRQRCACMPCCCPSGLPPHTMPQALAAAVWAYCSPWAPLSARRVPACSCQGAGCCWLELCCGCKGRRRGMPAHQVCAGQPRPAAEVQR